MSLLTYMDVTSRMLHLSASTSYTTPHFTRQSLNVLSSTATASVLNIIHVQGLNHAEIDFTR